MKTKGPYTVRAYQFQGCDHCEVEQEFDTLSEAKMRAKRYLSEEERALTEASHRLGYSSVENADGECVADYFNSKNVLTPMLAIVP